MCVGVDDHLWKGVQDLSAHLRRRLTADFLTRRAPRGYARTAGILTSIRWLAQAEKPRYHDKKQLSNCVSPKMRSGCAGDGSFVHSPKPSYLQVAVECPQRFFRQGNRVSRVDSKEPWNSPSRSGTT